MITNVKVKCDNPDCNWSLVGALIRQWHNRVCPRCGECIIITDAELTLWLKLEKLSTISNVLAGLPGFSRKHIHVDSAVVLKR